MDEYECEEHLAELRRRIIAVLVVFSAASLAAFAFSSSLVSFLTAPLSALNVKLYTFAPSEKFMAYLHLSAWAGAVFAAPFFCLQAGLFLWPGLRGREHRYALIILLIVPTLFLAGAGLCYQFMAPIVFRFFLSFAAGDGVEQLWNLKEYLSLLFAIMIASGLLLQLPLAVFVLVVTGLVSPARAARYRPHIVLFIFFMGAVFTPPDVISQVMLAVPLYLLFEAALWCGAAISKRNTLR